MAVTLRELTGFLDRELDIGGIEDKSKNGLQVEGPAEVGRVALAVDACQAAFEGAKAAGADLLIVHHGLFWGDVEGLRNVLFQRIRFLVENRLGLYAAHLPLDRHVTLGHNARLCDMLGVTDRTGFAKVRGKHVGYRGRLDPPLSVDRLVEVLRDRLNAEPKVLRGTRDTLETVGIVSGGGGYDFWEALDLDLDCYITGETCYSVFHDAVESGKTVVFAGHYETETPGLLALGGHLEEKLGLATVFVDVPAPAY